MTFLKLVPIWKKKRKAELSNLLSRLENVEKLVSAFSTDFSLTTSAKNKWGLIGATGDEAGEDKCTEQFEPSVFSPKGKRPCIGEFEPTLLFFWPNGICAWIFPGLGELEAFQGYDFAFVNKLILRTMYEN